MLQGVKSQINIEIFPAKIMAVNKADILYLRKTGIFEPREFLIRHKIFFAPYKEPNSVRGDVQNFNF